LACVAAISALELIGKRRFHQLPVWASTVGLWIGSAFLFSQGLFTLTVLATNQHTIDWGRPETKPWLFALSGVAFCSGLVLGLALLIYSVHRQKDS
jgi:hypothetical protein